ncbi:hypothetical protein KIH39_07045 [Telmatocola sphagniphila]|uniref:Uncharacterized protein n=1 Tax=Telmatocola sphagniphila TaxID=1123043 RepID=A0A8E6B933_9BACT|nr:hypothetical protein [Telmatocola sphagniphila]QVL33659.1 hypothetical protein KIH39_07045 [Telmatocola sphagniphila]
MHPATDDIYVLKMSAHLAPKCHNMKESDLPISSDALDEDEVVELPETDDDGIDDLEEMMLEPVGPAPTFKEFRYELCPQCHKKFLEDPLNREAFKLDFSKN